MDKFFILYSCIIILMMIALGNGNETENVDEVAFDNGTITEKQCNTELNGCCEEIYIGEEDGLVKCFAIHSTKLPGPGDDSDSGKLIKFLSCFVECIYKQKKYIGKSDTINMKMVRLDAEKMYPDRPKEKEYHIKMYDFCRKDANNLYMLLKASPGGSAMLHGACRPYLLMVFLCQTDYHKKQGCPYFRWEGSKKAGTAQMCKNAQDECYKLDGIVTQSKFKFLK